MLKKLAAGCLLSASALTVTACSTAPEPTLADTSTVQEAEDILDGADQIVAQESLMSWGNAWTVTVDGKEFGHVYGKNFKAFGETYLIHDSHDNLIAGETEEFWSVPRAARFLDSNGEVEGEVNQKMFSLMARFTLTQGGKDTAVMEEKFSLTTTANIKDDKGDVAYRASEPAFSMAQKVTIDKKKDNSSVSGADALLLAIIFSDISADND